MSGTWWFSADTNGNENRPLTEDEARELTEYWRKQVADAQRDLRREELFAWICVPVAIVTLAVIVTLILKIMDAVCGSGAT